MKLRHEPVQRVCERDKTAAIQTRIIIWPLRIHSNVITTLITNDPKALRNIIIKLTTASRNDIGTNTTTTRGKGRGGGAGIRV